MKSNEVSDVGCVMSADAISTSSSAPLTSLKNTFTVAALNPVPVTVTVCPYCQAELASPVLLRALTVAVSSSV
jgi:hypothetical protein